jgi:N-acetylmuramoyl-L-alanine amidase
MKKWIWPLFFLFILCLFPLQNAVYADSEIKLMIEGKTIDPDVPPKIQDGRTLVPLRIISENLGAKVGWFANTQKIVIVKDKTTVMLTLNNKKVIVNGKETWTEIAPFVEHGRTLVPLRAIGEWLGATVGWEEKERIVIVSHPISLHVSGQAIKPQKSPVLIGDIPYVDLSDIASSFQYEIASINRQTVKLFKSTEKPTEQQGKTRLTYASAQHFATNGSENILLTAWSNTLEKNGQAVSADYPPRIIDQSFMVPLTMVNKLFPAQTDWNSQTREIHIQLKRTPSTNLATVKQIELEQNRVAISGRFLSGQKPNIFTLNDPQRIVIDIPQAELANDLPSGSFIANEFADSFISAVRFSQFDEQTVRVVMDLTAPVTFHWNQDEDGNIEVNVALQSAANEYDHEDLTVVIDAGHGGRDPGAIGQFSEEKDINLAIANEVVSLLKEEPGMTVIATRTDDVFLELSERVAIANEAAADLFISIHVNSFPDNPLVTGSETYYYSEEGRKFAAIAQKQLIAATGFNDRGIKTAPLYVIRHTTMPAVLIETGFISNPAEEEALNSNAMQKRIARAIVDAIKEYRIGM